MPVKILIADDHRLFREGLRYILVQLDGNPEILEADRCDEALSMAGNHPDLSLVMLDIAMPDMNGCDALQLFSKRHPSMPVVMLTASENARDMRRAFDEGASGYIPKSSGADMMLGALQLVLAGGIYVPPSLAGIGKPSPGNANTSSLTGRQLEVVQYLQDGLSNKQIATRLGLTEATIKVHMSAIFRALDVHSRTEAAIKAQALLNDD